MNHVAQCPPSDRWVAFNAVIGTYEEVFPESEILPGETVIRQFFHRPSGRYVTIPGASLYRVDEAYAWVHIA
jgi:hypothetical protein